MARKLTVTVSDLRLAAVVNSQNTMKAGKTVTDKMAEAKMKP